MRYSVAARRGPVMDKLCTSVWRAARSGRSQAGKQTYVTEVTDFYHPFQNLSFIINGLIFCAHFLGIYVKLPDSLGGGAARRLFSTKLCTGFVDI
jgi:hypothetical protein